MLSVVNISFLATILFFLNPIEDFWAKLKDVVEKDPASVRGNTQLSERIRRASERRLPRLDTAFADVLGTLPGW